MLRLERLLPLHGVRRYEDPPAPVGADEEAPPGRQRKRGVAVLLPFPLHTVRRQVGRAHPDGDETIAGPDDGVEMLALFPSDRLRPGSAVGGRHAQTVQPDADEYPLAAGRAIGDVD